LLKIEPGEGSGAPKQEQAPKEEKAAPKEEQAPKEPAPKTEAAPAAPKKEPAPAPKAAPQEEPSAAQPAAPGSRSENRVKMNRMRLRIAERLKESQNTNASLTTFNEVDMSSLMEMRKLYKDDILKKTGVKFGFMGAFTRAACLAMKEIPAVNASIEGGDMVYRDYVDVSIAVATPKGLVTPVVRNAESMDVLTIEKTIHDLGVKARDGKLTLEDMAGGTFTISNGGVFGSLYGTPIINVPQAAVLGLHSVKDRPVVVNGQVVARPMMYLALTYDHRILDGREAVTFLKTVKELIEDPRRMLLA
jgi:2-oxoglutarate dehydrogenase E2 component (dihydrolipoamide succinyltransferase)